MILLRCLLAFVLGTVLSTIGIIAAAFAFWSVVPMNLSKPQAAVFFLLIAPGFGLAAGTAIALRTGFRPGRAPTGERPVPAPDRTRTRVLVSPASPAERVLGWTHAVIGAAGLAAGVYLLGGEPRAIESILGIPAIHLWPVFMLLAIGLLLPCLLGGLALLGGRQEGRPVVSVVSVLLLVAFPVGTALGLWGLVVLRRGRRAAAPAPMSPASRAFQARREAYEADQDATLTCPHLAPIERASRHAGMRLTPVAERDVLIIDPVHRLSLERLIQPGSPLCCIEVPAAERSLLDPPKPMLHCSACGSSLLFEDAGAPPPTGR